MYFYLGVMELVYLPTKLGSLWGKWWENTPATWWCGDPEHTVKPLFFSEVPS